MSRNRASEFKPDYAEHPGAYLEDILEQRGIRKADLALRCGRPAKTISEIIAGKAAIMPDTALQLERVLDVNASLWLAWECEYQLHEARVRRRKDLAKEVSWVQNFPVLEMQEKGLLPKLTDQAEVAESLLVFFGVSSPTAWGDYWRDLVSSARFKRSPQAPIDNHAIAAWLRAGDIAAAELECASYSESSFKDALLQARALTRSDWASAQPQLVKLFASCGVALAFVPSLSRTGLRGAAYWLSKDKAVIVISDRLKRGWAIWFALFHEAMHILLHSKKAVFIDFDNAIPDGKIDAEEEEADERAANALISTAQLQAFLAEYGTRRDGFTVEQIEAFSKEISISPSLLLKRLQHDNFVSHRSQLNKAFPDKIEFNTGWGSQSVSSR